MTSERRLFPRITDEMVEGMRARIGERLKDPHPPFVSEATIDNSRHYAYGIGDDNPLWSDEGYGRSTPYGDIIAVPTLLFASSPGGIGLTGMPGIHAMFAGCDFTWHQPIRRNEKIRSVATIKDIIERKTSFAGRAIQQVHHMEFSNGDGEPLASLDVWNFRTDRDEAREKGQKYERDRDLRTRYTREQIERFLAHYDAETIRGATPRYWEDTQVGEQLPLMVKGPMTVTGFISYLQGWGGIYIRAHRMFHKQLKRLPALAIHDEYGVPDCPESVHWRDDYAKLVGAPGPYDYGTERCSWLGHLVTDWMGDAGFMERLIVRLKRHNIVGDLLYLRGTVTKRSRDDTGAHVEIALEARNQDDLVSAQGSAVVRLPTR